jgi:uncharacterized membrane protein
MAGYLTTLRKDIARWQAGGLVDERTAAALLHDAENRPGRISFGSILSILAAVLLGALTFAGGITMANTLPHSGVGCGQPHRRSLTWLRSCG